ncbi:hypothetical protein C9374_014378 [Naegleria lovaniensis]|uniref:Uncharacterized protein n=1 Tax=Naegleria lovaniensis TaxID=51637 RepID=A0AA88H0N7_NAELO|nr:uncharacterized protein C9374_014378 [Naegleria lovaniensis]KAG2388978.1 hypothetical protein C9374_014378 [Naegleria lovaniensis]
MKSKQIVSTQELLPNSTSPQPELVLHNATTQPRNTTTSNGSSKRGPRVRFLPSSRISSHEVSRSIVSNSASIFRTTDYDPPFSSPLEPSESGLFPVPFMTGNSFSMGSLDKMLYIFQGQLEPCRYQINFKRVLQSSFSLSEPVSIHVEAMDMSFDLKAEIQKEENHWSTEFNLFRNDNEKIQRMDLIMVKIWVSRSVLHHSELSFDLLLFKKKEIIQSIKLDMSNPTSKSLKIPNVGAGIYEVFIRSQKSESNASTQNTKLNRSCAQLNVKITAYEHNEIKTLHSFVKTPVTSDTLEFNWRDEDLVAPSTAPTCIHREVAKGVAFKNEDWLSRRFVVYRRANNLVSSHISMTLMPSKQATNLGAYQVIVYRVSSDTPVMEISQHELSRLCSHLLTRIFYAFHIKKNAKELKTIVHLCEKYGHAIEMSSPLRKVQAIANSKLSQMNDEQVRKREAEEQKSKEISPLEQATLQILQTLGMIFKNKQPIVDLEELFSQQQPIMEEPYQKIIRDECDNEAKQCGPMSYLLKTLYETIQMVREELKNEQPTNSLTQSRKELLTKQAIWRKIAGTFSNTDEKLLWQVQMGPEDEDYFLLDTTDTEISEFTDEISDIDEDEDGDIDMYDDQHCDLAATSNESKPKLMKEPSKTLSRPPSSKSYLSFANLMAFAVFTKDQMVCKPGEQEVFSKLSPEHFQAIYNTARLVILHGLKHIQKRTILRNNLEISFSRKLAETISYILNSSLAEKYIHRDEFSKARRMLYALQDGHEEKYNSLMNDNMLTSTQSESDQMHNCNETQSESIISTTVSTTQSQPTQSEIPSITIWSEDQDDHSLQEVTVYSAPYQFFGMTKVSVPEMSNPSEFVNIFVNQVEALDSYINSLSDNTTEMCDENNHRSMVSAYIRKCILPSFRALFLGPEENPDDIFISDTFNVFHYFIHIVRRASVPHNETISVMIQTVLQVQQDIRMEDLWLDDNEHLMTTRFNAFWCHVINAKKCVDVFDEICNRNYYSTYFKNTPKFIHEQVKQALRKLCSLPLQLKIDRFQNEYNPFIIVEEDDSVTVSNE